MKNYLKLLGLLAVCGSLVAGCYQIHSDDDLRSVPTTNNPNLRPVGVTSSPAPKAGF